MIFAKRHSRGVAVVWVTGWLLSATLHAQDANTQPSWAPVQPVPSPAVAANRRPDADDQRWNFHAQNTIVMQGDPGFPAKYSGPNSLNANGEIQETVTADLYAGMRLWRGAEAHADLLMWQGFGLSQSFGIEAFPDGDAYKAGTARPNYTFAHLFVRQTIGLRGTQEVAPDGPLTLASTQDISRITITIGRMSPLDVVDNNRYSGNPHTQFMNWALMANAAFDYGQDTVGFTTGVAFELNRPAWALRYTFFQMPKEKNGFTGDDRLLMWPRRGSYGPFLRAWSMAEELEERYRVRNRPGAIRVMAWQDEANFATYQAATAYLLAQPPGAGTPQGVGVNIPDSIRAYRHKYGFGVSWEQELSKSIGVFSRLGWCDGQEDTFTYTDADYTVSGGVSVRGESWHRQHDTFGLAGIANGASLANQKFLEAGGEDMLDGDGRLTYGWEKTLEAYYDLHVWKVFRLMLDYQFVVDPAFNRDRGPVSVFGARLHWEL